MCASFSSASFQTLFRSAANHRSLLVCSPRDGPDLPVAIKTCKFMGEDGKAGADRLLEEAREWPVSVACKFMLTFFSGCDISIYMPDAALYEIVS